MKKNYIIGSIILVVFLTFAYAAINAESLTATAGLFSSLTTSNLQVNGNANLTGNTYLTPSWSGWANYADTTYNESSPLVVLANTPTVLENNGLNAITHQLPLDIDTFYNGSKIIGNLGDSILITVDFTAKPTTAAATQIDIWMNISGNFTELYRRTTGFSKGVGVEQHLTSTTMAYNLDTWVQNGAEIYLQSNGPVDVYDVRFVISRQHKGR